MAQVNIKINSKNYTVDSNRTVLEVCRENGIDIPTLCYNEQLAPYGSCFLCTVELKGSRRKFNLSCATQVMEGMEIVTDSEELWDQRKMALELLLSNHNADCIGPCKNTCPSNVDVQGYIAAIAEGDYTKAIEIIKNDNPFPSVCGRVCTRPCEEECRRNLIDTTVAIDFLKRYAADKDLTAKHSFKPEVKEKTGKNIAIVGAGPSGLSAAYYLAKEGHDIDVFEQYEAAGGMMRFGIPEYRQPNDVLDAEVKKITDLGPKIHYNKKLGKDITVEGLRKEYDAVYLAIGAHECTFMGIDGENADGSFGGIDFLREAARGKKPEIGKDVIVIGGGNTAIDCARVSKRLGANVTMVYRRTIAEMPAHHVEIEDAQAEGINIEILTNPVKVITDKNGKVTGIECMKMALGEPDASGRRRPEPVKDSEFTINASSVIFAIGQKSDIDCVDSPEGKICFTRWKTVEADDRTFATGMTGVFGGGDFRRGADTVIGAIADGKKAAWVMDKYLATGNIMPYPDEFFSRKDNIEKQIPEMYENKEKKEKNEMPKLNADERTADFREVELGYSDEAAKAETNRCLECGCQSVFDCELKDNATCYNANQSYYKGQHKDIEPDLRHPFIHFEPNKCISCARCVRMCKEVVGLSVLGLVNRGYKTLVQPSIGKSLQETDCIECGLCADVCPTGAIVIRPNTVKPGPFELKTEKAICPFCSFGCEIEVQSLAGKIVNIKGLKNSTVNAYGNICKLGRFGFRKLNWNKQEKPDLKPVIDALNDKWKETAIFVGDSSTVEEMYAWKLIADATDSQIGSVKNTNIGVKLFGYNSRFKELRRANTIIIAELNPYDDVPMLMPEIMKRRKAGAYIIYAGKEDHRMKRIASRYIVCEASVCDGLKLIDEEKELKGSVIALTSYRAEQTGALRALHTLTRGRLIVFGESANTEGAKIAGLSEKIEKKFKKAIFYNEMLPADCGLKKEDIVIFSSFAEKGTLPINNALANAGTVINAGMYANSTGIAGKQHDFTNLELLADILNKITGSSYTEKSLREEALKKLGITIGKTAHALSDIASPDKKVNEVIDGDVYRQYLKDIK